MKRILITKELKSRHFKQVDLKYINELICSLIKNGNITNKYASKNKTNFARVWPFVSGLPNQKQSKLSHASVFIFGNIDITLT